MPFIGQLYSSENNVFWGRMSESAAPGKIMCCCALFDNGTLVFADKNSNGILLTLTIMLWLYLSSSSRRGNRDCCWLVVVLHRRAIVRFHHYFAIICRWAADWHSEEASYMRWCYFLASITVRPHPHPLCVYLLAGWLADRLWRGCASVYVELVHLITYSNKGTCFLYSERIQISIVTASPSHYNNIVLSTLFLSPDVNIADQ